MSLLNSLARAFVCALILSAASVVGKAQEPAAAAAAAPARVEIVLSGGKGSAAPELKREDVRVYVDGVERPVVSFEREVLPVSYGLVVVNSGSLRSQIGLVTAAAKYLVDQGGPNDEAFVLRFVASEDIAIIQRLTNDKARLHGALDSMFIRGGYTALLDALYDAGRYLSKSADRSGAQGRRLALVLITDGEDRGSSYKVQEVLKPLREGGVQVFCVGLMAELENQQVVIGLSRREKAKNLLAKIADETGGRVFYTDTPAELEAAARDVAASLRTRYLVGYALPEPGAEGQGKVEIKLVGAAAKAKLKAEARP